MKWSRCFYRVQPRRIPRRDVVLGDLDARCRMQFSLVTRALRCLTFGGDSATGTVEIRLLYKSDTWCQWLHIRDVSSNNTR